MTKEELEKEAEKHADGIYYYKINVSDYGEDGIINYRYSDVKEVYQKGAEPREKRIAELENKIADIKANCDLAIEGRDVKIMELEQQIEKMKVCQNCDFIFRDWGCYYDKECKNKDHWKLRR